MERPKCCKNPIVPILSIENLPNEILMNIFSNLNIKDLYKSAHVSKKFRQISHDKSFWKCVNLFNQKVSCEFLGQILKLGTEYLNLQGATILDDVEAVIPQNSNLKYLNLAFTQFPGGLITGSQHDILEKPRLYWKKQYHNNKAWLGLQYLNPNQDVFCIVDDRFLLKLLKSSVSLEKVSFTGVNQKEVFYDFTPDYDRWSLYKRKYEELELSLALRRSLYI